MGDVQVYMLAAGVAPEVVAEVAAEVEGEIMWAPQVPTGVAHDVASMLAAKDISSKCT